MPSRTRRGHDRSGEKQPDQQRSQRTEHERRGTARAGSDRDIRPRDAEGRFIERRHFGVRGASDRRVSGNEDRRLGAERRLAGDDNKRTHTQPTSEHERPGDNDPPRDAEGRFSDRNKSGSH
jgi:hypothetical protein